MPENSSLVIIRDKTTYTYVFQKAGLAPAISRAPIEAWQREEALKLFHAHVDGVSGRSPGTANSPRPGGAPVVAGPEGLGKMGNLLYLVFLPVDVKKALREDGDEPLMIQTEDWELPWELVWDGVDFLSVRRPVARCPVNMVLQRPPAPKPVAELRFLLISADPYDDLPHVHPETNELYVGLKKRGVPCELLGKGEAVWNKVENKLAQRSYDVIHFAGHVKYDPLDPSKCGLLLEDGNLLRLDQIESVGLNGHPLVFVNGCHSGCAVNARDSQVPDTMTGELPQGVAFSFIKGGAWAFVGSHWCISDECSHTFALEFYRKCLAGMSIGEALRATREMVKRGDPEGCTWPAYIHYGDPAGQLVRAPAPPATRTRRWILFSSIMATLLALVTALVLVFRPVADNCYPETIPPAAGTQIMVRGARLLQAEGISLERENHASIPAADVKHLDNRSLQAVFDLDNAENGAWNVVTTNSWGLKSTCVKCLYIEKGGERYLKTVEFESPRDGYLSILVYGSGMDESMTFLLANKQERIQVIAQKIDIISDYMSRVYLEERKLFPGQWDLVGEWNDGTRSTLPGILGIPSAAPSGVPSSLPILTRPPEPTAAPTVAATDTATVAAPATAPSATAALTTDVVSPSNVPTVQTPEVTDTLPPVVRKPTVYQGPALQFPQDNASVSGWSVRLVWQDSPPLGEDEFYDVLVYRDDESPQSKGWSKTTSYEIGEEQLPPGYYSWRIVRIRFLGTDNNGNKQITAITPESETWHFRWRSAGGGGKSPSDPDNDGDGYAASVDCNDNDARVHPGAYDPRGDDLDRNCDGKDD